MITITANDSLQKSLGEFDRLTEIRDSQGHVIGFFSPVAYREAAAYSQAAADLDPNELKRRKDSRAKGLTTAEVLDHLHSLEK